MPERAADAVPDPPGRGTTYLIDGGRRGRDRLAVLSRALAPTTTALLDHVGIRPDAVVLDLGCGGGDVTRLLAGRTPRGRVVGVDADPSVVAIARDELAAAGVDNVELVVADATRLDLDPASFDVVYARFLLTHLPDPDAVLAGMVALCRPGGVVVVEDVDIAGAVCWPPDGTHDRCIDLYRRASRARGGDPELGLRLPAMLHHATGGGPVGTRVVQPGGLGGDAKQIVLLTLAATADALCSLGLATREEVERLQRDLAAFTARPDTFLTTARIVQAWSRVPG